MAVSLCERVITTFEVQNHHFHTSYVPLGEFSEATLFVKNNLTRSALTIRVDYSDIRGRAVHLAMLDLGPQSYRNLDLRELLPKSTVHEGARFSLSYRGRSSGSLAAEVNLRDREARVSFSVVALNAGLEFANTQLNGLAFVPNARSRIFVYASNLSDKARTVTLRSHSDGAHSSRTVRLGPGSSKRLSVATRGLGAVGLRVGHDGRGGEVLYSGLVRDETSGYSKRIAFRDPNWAQSQQLAASQIVLDTPPESLALPGHLSFRSFLSLFNASSQQQVVRLSLFVRGDLYELPEATVDPWGVRLISLNDLQMTGLLPSQVDDAFILGIHTGPRGSLVGEVLTIDSTADYVLSTPIKSSQGFAFLSREWTIERNCNTILSLLNASPETSLIKLSAFNGGVEYSTALRVAPLEQFTVDFRDLVESGKLVSDSGIRLSETSGVFRVNNQRINDGLVMHYQVVDPDLGTCEEVEEESVYYLETEHRYSQPQSEGSVYIKTIGLMSDESENDVSLTTVKTVNGSGIDWASNGKITITASDPYGSPPPERSISDTVNLIACASGSNDFFTYFSLIGTARTDYKLVGFIDGIPSPGLRTCYYNEYCPTSTPTCPSPTLTGVQFNYLPCDPWVDHVLLTFRIFPGESFTCFPVGKKKGHNGPAKSCT